MELIKIVIHSRLGAKPFDNVFCARNGGGDLVATTPATIFGAVFGNPAVTNWNIWDGDDGDYPDDPALLQAIVAFMTYLRFPNITITGATISDGEKGSPIFYPVAINQPGTRPYPSGDSTTLVPGSIIWDIIKVPGELGVNFGHIELRCALDTFEILNTGNDMLDWRSPVVSAAAEGRIDLGTELSSLDNYFMLEPGGSPGFELCIPRAYPKGHLQAGSWYDAFPVKEFNAGQPRDRQVHRGKKES